MRTGYIAGLTFGLALFMTACTSPVGVEFDEAEVSVADAQSPIRFGPGTAGKTYQIGQVDLVAGQNEVAGSVVYSYDDVARTITVTFVANAPWAIDATHVWIGSNLADMPQTRTGNPQVGKFPYTAAAPGFSVAIPLGAAGLTECGDTFRAAAHAALRITDGPDAGRTETGWGAGTRFVERGSWATYTLIQEWCQPTVVPETQSETAFAYVNGSATCFLNVTDPNGHTFNRWGWTNGPLGAGTYNAELWAGAGRCDRSKGTLVGSVRIVYDGVNATVTYTMTAPYRLLQAQTYVGSELLPKDVNGEWTVAPGQYPVVDDSPTSTGDHYTFTGLSGPVYMVAHATVGGF